MIALLELVLFYFQHTTIGMLASRLCLHEGKSHAEIRLEAAAALD